MLLTKIKNDIPFYGAPAVGLIDKEPTYCCIGQNGQPALLRGQRWKDPMEIFTGSDSLLHFPDSFPGSQRHRCAVESSCRYR